MSPLIWPNESGMRGEDRGCATEFNSASFWRFFMSATFLQTDKLNDGRSKAEEISLLNLRDKRRQDSKVIPPIVFARYSTRSVWKYSVEMVLANQIIYSSLIRHKSVLLQRIFTNPAREMATIRSPRSASHRSRCGNTSCAEGGQTPNGRGSWSGGGATKRRKRHQSRHKVTTTFS